MKRLRVYAILFSTVQGDKIWQVRGPFFNVEQAQEFLVISSQDNPDDQQLVWDETSKDSDGYNLKGRASHPFQIVPMYFP